MSLIVNFNWGDGFKNEVWRANIILIRIKLQKIVAREVSIELMSFTKRLCRCTFMIYIPIDFITVKEQREI